MLYFNWTFAKMYLWGPVIYGFYIWNKAHLVRENNMLDYGEQADGFAFGKPFQMDIFITEMGQKLESWVRSLTFEG